MQENEELNLRLALTVLPKPGTTLFGVQLYNQNILSDSLTVKHELLRRFMNQSWIGHLMNTKCTKIQLMFPE